MGVGVIILVIVLAVLAALGGGLYSLMMWLRGRKLSRHGDAIEGAPERRPRPEHVKVDNEHERPVEDPAPHPLKTR